MLLAIALARAKFEELLEGEMLGDAGVGIVNGNGGKMCRNDSDMIQLDPKLTWLVMLRAWMSSGGSLRHDTESF